MSTFDVSQIRAQFPALSRPADPATSDTPPVFFDNPAGSQVPQRVIDAVSEYYLTMNANKGGAFAHSQQTEAAMFGARQRMADLLNAPRPDEIVFGPNMTTLSFSFSRALGATLSPGDEIVLTRMEHDANAAPWLRLAQDRDLVIKWVEINNADATLDMDSLEAALTPRTKVVATVHVSNAVGTLNPVQHIGAMAHAAGALFVVDAVQSTPHMPVDVQAMGADVLFCSAYKFFGPHIGVMWGRYDLLAALPAYQVRPAKDTPPHRWETGTQSHETIHAVSGAVDYLEWVGQQFGAGPADGLTGRRQTLRRAMTAIAAYENELGAYLIAELLKLPGVRVAGITDPARMAQRVPTIPFVIEGVTPQVVAEYLGRQHIQVRAGDYYAQEVMRALGHGEHGMVRVGPVHYNTPAEVDRLIAALEALPGR